MIYDAFGNRVAKTVNGVTTQYLVEDDVNPTGLPQVVEEVLNGAAVTRITLTACSASAKTQASPAIALDAELLWLRWRRQRASTD